MSLRPWWQSDLMLLMTTNITLLTWVHTLIPTSRLEVLRFPDTYLMPVESTVRSLGLSGLAFNNTSGSHNLAEKLMKVKINSDNANPISAIIVSTNNSMI
jgi:hypothetical protein